MIQRVSTQQGRQLLAEAQKKPHKKAKRFDWADTLAFQIRAAGLPEPEREQRLLKPRMFRTDLCWRSLRIFAECDGSEWAMGRHSRGYGMNADNEKWDMLARQGWAGYRFTGSQVKSGYALNMMQGVLLPYVTAPRSGK